MTQDLYSLAFKGHKKIDPSTLRAGDSVLMVSPSIDPRTRTILLLVVTSTGFSNGFVATVSGRDEEKRAVDVLVNARQTWYLLERPQPPAPTGYAAVVRVNGVVFWRTGILSQYPWLNVDGEDFTWEELLDLGDPEVLFSGVTR